VLVALVVSPWAAAVTAHGAADAPFVAGGRSLGDSLFPHLGNTGYDALHYDLDLAYEPGLRELSGTSTMTARATENLREFSLDFQGFSISALTVDGVAAHFLRVATKLVITPSRGIADGSTFTVAVTYAGKPPRIVDPDGSAEGWLPTYDGAFVVGEPMGAQGWFPCNNHPLDKATYDETVTVPLGLSVLGNGLLVSHEDHAPTTTWHWRETDPMATYLGTMTLGVFQVTNSVTSEGLPRTDAVDVAYLAATEATGTLARQPDMISFFESLYGPYPFSAGGGIVGVAPAVGYSLETQTRPNYPLPPDATTVAHETSHQWFGDSVSLTRWKDIWLNEGFATVSQWLYEERRDGGPKAAANFAHDAGLPPGDALWKIAPADPPTAADIFASQVYERGGATLEGLREVVGDAAFASIMTSWATAHRHGWGTTGQFVALALAKSGLDDVRRSRLATYLDQWLHRVGKPSVMPADVLAAVPVPPVPVRAPAPVVAAATKSRNLPATGALPDLSLALAALAAGATLAPRQRRCSRR